MESLERFMVAIPKHGGNKTTWWKRKLKSWFKSNDCSAFSEFIFFHSSRLFIQESALHSAIWDWTSHPDLPFPPQHRPDRQCRASSFSFLLLILSCWESSIFLPLHLFLFNKLCDQTIGCLLYFSQKGEQSPLTTESERPLLLGCSLLTFCNLPPGDQPVFYVLTQYEILVFRFLSFLD